MMLYSPSVPYHTTFGIPTLLPFALTQSAYITHELGLVYQLRVHGPYGFLLRVNMRRYELDGELFAGL